VEKGGGYSFLGIVGPSDRRTAGPPGLRPPLFSTGAVDSLGSTLDVLGVKRKTNKRRLPAASPEETLFADAPDHAREALALHKAEARRNQRREFLNRITHDQT
jgi:hypothetical protein